MVINVSWDNCLMILFFSVLILKFEIQSPTTIVPFFGDQFFWGETIHQKGLGPAPIPISQLNTANLSNAINFMLQPEVRSSILLLNHKCNIH